MKHMLYINKAVRLHHGIMHTCLDVCVCVRFHNVIKEQLNPALLYNK